jgi:integrase
MRNPPGYGSVIDLGKNRRRPIAVRVPNGYKLTPDQREIPQYKYLGYFPRTPQGKADAQLLLAQYNAGIAVNVFQGNSAPTFEEIFTKWLERHLGAIESRRGGVSKQLEQSYRAAFKRCQPIHTKKINTIKFQEVQFIADSAASMSQSTVTNLKTVLFEVFDLARKQKFIDENFIPDIEFNYKKTEKSIHDTFTQEEVDLLWKHSADKNIQIVLIMIYTGLRIEELLIMENKNVFLSDQYMVGGVKTTSGKNRIIPIADKILPFVAALHSDKRYLLDNNGTRYYRKSFLEKVWTPAMGILGAAHMPHDTRYTCASMLDRAGANQNAIKDILGHSKDGVTNKVYVKKDITDLLAAVNSI